jgi:hypothetical protein
LLGKLPKDGGKGATGAKTSLNFPNVLSMITETQRGFDRVLGSWPQRQLRSIAGTGNKTRL